MNRRRGPFEAALVTALASVDDVGAQVVDDAADPADGHPVRLPICLYGQLSWSAPSTAWFGGVGAK